jgi:tetratricopeptide (TPR) repeat protein
LQRWQEGLSAFKIAAALRPNDAFVQFALAKAYGATEHTLEAIDALKEAIRLDPKFTVLRRALCKLRGVAQAGPGR